MLCDCWFGLGKVKGSTSFCTISQLAVWKLWMVFHHIFHIFTHLSKSLFHLQYIILCLYTHFWICVLLLVAKNCLPTWWLVVVSLVFSLRLGFACWCVFVHISITNKLQDKFFTGPQKLLRQSVRLNLQKKPRKREKALDVIQFIKPSFFFSLPNKVRKVKVIPILMLFCSAYLYTYTYIQLSHFQKKFVNKLVK